MPDNLIYIRTSPTVDLCVRSQQGQYDLPTVLFIHGLGDSSLCWKSFYQRDDLLDFTLLAPDLPGYGRTRLSKGTGGGIAAHVKHLRALIEEIVGGPLLVVGHSLGGLIATYLVRAIEQAEAKPTEEKVHEPVRLLGLINVEGNLTGADAFISSRATRADQRGHFDEWYEAFVRTSYEGLWADANPHLKHYPDSLRMADPTAFLADCHEMVALKTRTDGDSGENEAGGEYLKIRSPKLYVYGTESIPQITLDFLARNELNKVVVDGAGHWAMHDDPDRFINLLLEWLR
ncbi:alpha/beta hydrolase [bacterium]|nr:alpha/beta hydrolase [bacterium]